MYLSFQNKTKYDAEIIANELNNYYFNIAANKKYKLP